METESKPNKFSTLEGTSDLISNIDGKGILVLDIGSRNTRVGYPGQNLPKLTLRSRLGISKGNKQEIDSLKLNRFCGNNVIEEMNSKEIPCSLEYPLVKMINSVNMNFLKILNKEKKEFQSNNVEEETSQFYENNDSLSKNDNYFDSSLNIDYNIDKDIEFFLKHIIEREMELETNNLDLMITLNKGKQNNFKKEFQKNFN